MGKNDAVSVDLEAEVSSVSIPELAYLKIKCARLEWQLAHSALEFAAKTAQANLNALVSVELASLVGEGREVKDYSIDLENKTMVYMPLLPPIDHDTTEKVS